MRLIDADPIIKNLSAIKTQFGYDAINIDGMIKALREAGRVDAAQTPMEMNLEPPDGGIRLHSAIHGDGAYEAFKRIASEFYGDHTYKFVALMLDGEPREDIVTFTAEFWRTPGGGEASRRKPESKT